MNDILINILVIIVILFSFPMVIIFILSGWTEIIDFINDLRSGR